MNRRTVTILSAAVFALAIGAPAMAQEGRVNRDISPGEVASFNTFLNNHPDLARRMATDPKLINDPEYVRNHPELREYLAQHPGVREEIHESPGQFMYREKRYEWVHDDHGFRRAPGTPAGEMASMDNYFDHHADVARELRKNPALIDNQQYVDNHPGLHEYLRTHPEARHDFKTHPYRFIRRERRYDRREDSHSWNWRGPNGYRS